MQDKTAEKAKETENMANAQATTYTGAPRRSYKLDREGNVIFTDRGSLLREWAQKYNGTGLPR